MSTCTLKQQNHPAAKKVNFVGQRSRKTCSKTSIAFWDFAANAKKGVSNTVRWNSTYQDIQI